MKTTRIFHLEVFSFGGKILNIFEQACFHNEKISPNKGVESADWSYLGCSFMAHNFFSNSVQHSS